MNKAIFAIAVACVALPAQADELPLPAGAPKSFQAECGVCHMAFSPKLLAAGDWHRVMGGLARHYGTDASLDARTANEIRAFLERNAGVSTKTSGSADRPRITTTIWFKREHREVPTRLWKDPRVKSAANCTACHRGAEAGRFSENDFALPDLRGRED
jgi:nitrate/TMAO reductase-like tetraheme cytochrome c subunit